MFMTHTSYTLSNQYTPSWMRSWFFIGHKLTWDRAWSKMYSQKGFVILLHIYIANCSQYAGCLQEIQRDDCRSHPLIDNKWTVGKGLQLWLAIGNSPCTVISVKYAWMNEKGGERFAVKNKHGGSQGHQSKLAEFGSLLTNRFFLKNSEIFHLIITLISSYVISNMSFGLGC